MPQSLPISPYTLSWKSSCSNLTNINLLSWMSLSLILQSSTYLLNNPLLWLPQLRLLIPAIPSYPLFNLFSARCVANSNLLIHLVVLRMASLVALAALWDISSSFVARSSLSRRPHHPRSLATTDLPNKDQIRNQNAKKNLLTPHQKMTRLLKRLKRLISLKKVITIVILTSICQGLPLTILTFRIIILIPLRLQRLHLYLQLLNLINLHLQWKTLIPTSHIKMMRMTMRNITNLLKLHLPSILLLFSIALLHTIVAISRNPSTLTVIDIFFIKRLNKMTINQNSLWVQDPSTN